MPKSEMVQEVLGLVRQVRRALQRNSIEAWTDLDFTIPQLKTLFFIDANGTTNTKTISEKFGVTPSNMTGIIDRLVKQDLVSRQENPANRRMYDLRVSERGESIVTGMMERGARHLSEVIGHMSEEDLTILAGGLSLLMKVAEDI